MPYQSVKGRKPFERASKIAHAEIINSPAVQEFLKGCSLPTAPPAEDLEARFTDVPKPKGKIRTIIAVDGGQNETSVQKEFPSASLAFMTMGPVMLYLEHLKELDHEPFIAPEDMARLKRIKRYHFVMPLRGVRVTGCKTFAQGVRKSVHGFLQHGDGHLGQALRWLLLREWGTPVSWEIPNCPNPECSAKKISLSSSSPDEQTCSRCGQPIYFSDSLRISERIEEEQGAGAILAYLMTTLEQIVLVHVIKSVWDMKPAALREILFVKDGPLAFFGVTAPLHQPMRALMRLLAEADGGPLINLVGLEKSGAFVEHAALIEERMKPGQVLLLDNKYIYRYIVPGDPDASEYGSNTYYGAKAIFKGSDHSTYVATIPTREFNASPKMKDLVNGADVLNIVGQLRCSMYENALLPIVLANRLVSLADVPSSDILTRFAKDRIA